ncbi:GNAT family N-acetyltransferase [Clostridium thermarum]|uniref:GNAT family N-acetyltransferase n=1 Tax=Clostridium thermarum TaxID=1716543 RepID=UPI0013D56C35|nr:GNAT family N-acetyltransferase [Clostridium thermarum]
MRLRKLEMKDAELMLEWMHDESVVCNLGTDFMSKTIDDCKNFIRQSWDKKIDISYAIVDTDDIYMGTVSLKHISYEKKTAEFAIAIRKSAMGKGYSNFGMRSILQYGINELGLHAIYWCVSIDNKRAVRFYDKNQYVRTLEVPEDILKNYSPLQNENFIWYKFTDHSLEVMKEIAGTV